MMTHNKEKRGESHRNSMYTSSAALDFSDEFVTEFGQTVNLFIL